MSVGRGEEEPHNHRHACASCKHQRRKCQDDCIFAPFYPANRANYFREVHKIFGVKNVVHILENLSPEDRKRAVESLEWEALAWKQDPANGPLGALRKLEKENESLKNYLISNSIPQQIMMPYQTKPGLIGFGHNPARIVANNDNLNAANFGYVGAHNLGLDGNMNNYGGFLPRREVENQVPDHYIPAVPCYPSQRGQGRSAMQDAVGAATTNILPKQGTQRNHQTLDPVMMSGPAALFNQGHQQRGNQAKFHASSQGQGRSFLR